MRFFKTRQAAWEPYTNACKASSIFVRQVPPRDLSLHTSFCAERQVHTGSSPSCCL